MNINRKINHLEAILVADNKKKPSKRRFTAWEVETISSFLNMAKTIDTLLYMLNRPVPPEEED